MGDETKAAADFLRGLIATLAQGYVIATTRGFPDGKEGVWWRDFAFSVDLLRLIRGKKNQVKHTKSPHFF